MLFQKSFLKGFMRNYFLETYFDEKEEMIKATNFFFGLKLSSVHI